MHRGDPISLLVEVKVSLLAPIEDALLQLQPLDRTTCRCEFILKRPDPGVLPYTGPRTREPVTSTTTLNAVNNQGSDYLRA